VFGHAPAVSLVHGGLECAGISWKGGGLDTVSLGPTIENPHSPAERVFIPSLKRLRSLLAAVLEDYR
jgi:dipeptidase D